MIDSQAMSRHTQRQRQLRLVLKQKKVRAKRSSPRSRRNGGWEYAGAAAPTFLAPLAPDQEEPRSVSAPKCLDPSFIPSPRRREEVRRAAAKPAPKYACLYSLHPCRSLPGPILKFLS